MTQISKRLLRKSFQDRVYQTFWETIANLNDTREISLFFSEFFTKVEKVNFTKRLSIALMLYKGYDWRSINDLLKVSLTTIGKIASKMESSGFKIYFEKLEKDESWRKFWKDLVKTYLLITHPDKYARLGEEGIERVYFNRKKRS